MLNLSWPICNFELSYLKRKARVFNVACTSPLKKKLKLKLGMKKFEAYFLLVSGTTALCEGFSKESYSVPVLYWENCWPKSLTVKNNKHKTSKIFFIN